MTTTSSSSSTTGLRVVPEFLSEELRHSGLELRNLLNSLRGQVQDLDTLARGSINDEEWQRIPAELLNPQSQSRGRPTSKAALAKIPRIVVDDKCSLFRQSSLEITNGTTSIQCQAIIGEFGPLSGIKLSKHCVVVASPRTGKGGLSEETKSKICEGQETIVYMERGDGLTFVSKAILAQEAGASAVMIGNNISSPWPYVMKDLKSEAEKFGLKIPVAMVKQSDGGGIVGFCREHPTVTGDFTVESLSRDCVVCCDSLDVSQTVLQLPVCGHIFHDLCALAWLTKHNTCPYCRRELPTDDQEYENERRRVQRTHAGSASNGNEWGAYYG